MPLAHFMEACIVFARSVTLHLQKELAHADWYATRQDAMVIEPLFGFFRDRRNYILKEGRLGVRRTAGVPTHLGLRQGAGEARQALVSPLT